MAAWIYVLIMLLRCYWNINISQNFYLYLCFVHYVLLYISYICNFFGAVIEIRILVHLLPFIKEQSMFIRVNRIFDSAFQISITQT